MAKVCASAWGAWGVCVRGPMRVRVVPSRAHLRVRVLKRRVFFFLSDAYINITLLSVLILMCYVFGKYYYYYMSLSAWHATHRNTCQEDEEGAFDTDQVGGGGGWAR